MKRNLFVTLLCMLGMCAWESSIAQTAELGPQEEQAQLSEPIDPSLVEASIVGPDDRQEITGRATNFEKAVVVLRTVKASGKPSACSGTMVGPNVVLTAAHCLSEAGAYHKEVQVYAVGLPGNQTQRDQNPGQIRIPGIQIPGNNRQIPGRQTPRQIPVPGWRLPGGNMQRPNSNPGKPRLPNELLSRITKKQTHSKINFSNVLTRKMLPSVQEDGYGNMPGIGNLANRLGGAAMNGIPSGRGVKLWVPQEYLRLSKQSYDAAKSYDYGVIVLDNPLGRQTGCMGLATKSGGEFKNKRVVVIGRGADKPVNSLWKGLGKIGEVTNKYIYHSADMVGGNSGGPILDVNDQSRIIALNNFHSGEIHQSEGHFPNGGLRITQDIINAVNAHSR